MCKSVLDVLKNFLVKEFGLASAEEAEGMIRELQAKNKLCYEAWG
jgi:hypothetical protein